MMDKDRIEIVTKEPPSIIFSGFKKVKMVKFFSQAVSSPTLANILITKNAIGIPAPKLNEYFVSLNKQEKKKPIPLIAKLVSMVIKFNIKKGPTWISPGNIIWDIPIPDRVMSPKST